MEAIPNPFILKDLMYIRCVFINKSKPRSVVQRFSVTDLIVIQFYLYFKYMLRKDCVLAMDFFSCNNMDVLNTN